MIWQRQLLTYEHSLERIKKVLKAGYILISEFDDDPNHWPAIAQNKHLNFTATHAVQVSTAQLESSIRTHNPEIRVFGNCLEKLHDANLDKWNNTHQLKIFFGALNRKNDWSMWINALNESLRLNPNQWHIEVVHDKAFYDALCIDSKSFTPTCNYELYLAKMAECHIALLPLENTPFNHKKSDLKYIEASASGTASIASPTVYGQTIIDEKTGIICPSPQHLKSTLERWARNPDEAKRVALSTETGASK